ncbi:MAG TPA: toll/interleukin-1 receptor domain-containing protein [Cyclobacteriaceae bacterium]|jgi:hypothetical protein|nr:toll/interleukin-1 receptor domain-containing protein [Cyclobacteriaceae bacterium]
MKKVDYLYDVFISHAVEDKIAIANALFEALQAKGLKVWYSGRELSVGDRLTESIHKSLDQCRFGVVILSPTYLSKIWALNEFFFLLTREKNGEKVILPVLYDITPQQLATHSPLMADIFAVRADKGLDYVTDTLISEIIKQGPMIPPAGSIASSRKNLWAKLLAIFLTLIFALLLITYQAYNNRPDIGFIEQTIQKHIDDIQHLAEQELQQTIVNTNAIRTNTEEIQKLYIEYTEAKSYYRNEYTLNTGNAVVHSRKNVATMLDLDIQNVTPANLATISKPIFYRSVNAKATNDEAYTIYNKAPTAFHIETSSLKGDEYVVQVTYANNLRLLHTNLTFPTNSRDTKRYRMSVIALLPHENYFFIHKHNDWVLEKIE